jgi:hypothetical protein
LKLILNVRNLTLAAGSPLILLPQIGLENFADGFPVYPSLTELLLEMRMSKVGDDSRGSAAINLEGMVARKIV